MTADKKKAGEILELWKNFRKALEDYSGDSAYNELIRTMGFEVKHMVFENREIIYSSMTNFKTIIPYTILAGGYASCLIFISNEIDYIELYLNREGMQDDMFFDNPTS